MQLFSPALRNSFILRDFSSEFSNGPYSEGCSSGPSTLSGQTAVDYDFEFATSLWPGIELHYAPFNQTLRRNGSPRGRWCKIRLRRQNKKQCHQKSVKFTVGKNSKLEDVKFSIPECRTDTIKNNGNDKGLKKLWRLMRISESSEEEKQGTELKEVVKI
ncbi:hypothetical protein L1887_21825 [Cichorium endivia]|nr:hypothetical protein L1887_21825 [Cichorium endivia]